MLYYGFGCKWMKISYLCGPTDKFNRLFKNLTDMKKILILALAVCAVASCAKPTKCKCKLELNSEILNLELKDQIVERPEDKKCSQIKVEDIKGDIISVDLSKIGSIDCVNYQE